MLWINCHSVEALCRKTDRDLLMQGNHMNSAAAIRTAADTLVASSPLWSHGRMLLQTDSYAALLYNGTMLSLWHDQVSCPRDRCFAPGPLFPNDPCQLSVILIDILYVML